MRSEHEPDGSAQLPEDQALFFAGNQLMGTGDSEGAEQYFHKALALNPTFAEALCNLGLLREQAGAATEAEDCYRQAIAFRPDGVRFHMNLGVLLMKLRRFDEAEYYHQQALQLAPNSAEAWSNLGVLLVCTKREHEAEQCYRIALQLEANHAKAHFNLSYLLLRRGEFEEGWHHFETRTWQWYDILYDYFSFPRWKGEPLAGKSIVISFDAGHGDMIQFCRYAVVLKSIGTAWITVVCHPTLKRLFKTLSGADEVFSLEDDVAHSGWNFWTPPLSLPYYCKTRIENIPAPIPYLAADPTEAAKWLRLLDPCVLHVGLVWRGNPNFANDTARSLPSLTILAPLGSVPGVQLISLQKGAGEDEAQSPPAGLSLLALGGSLQDFADTAALISCLDLVISVDTAVAHLAGALGKPCWILLPDYWTDWRWLQERTDSPWYLDHFRLFRTPPHGDWSHVVTAVVAALEAWVTQRHHQLR